MKRTLLGIGLLAIAVTVGAPVAGARSIYVAADGSGDAPNLQAAVDMARTCDEIIVGPGVYTWDSQTPRTDFAMVFFDEDITAMLIRSEMGPESTILDAQGRGRILHITGERIQRRCLDGEPNPSGVPQPLLIEGFTFINGRAPEFGDYAGGAIAGHLSSTIVRNCVFKNNHADAAGGAYWWGGLSTARIEDCRFENNSARFGGAIFIFKSNTPLQVRNCVFVDNEATVWGGAIFAGWVRFDVVGCLFRRNRANSAGGAVYMDSVWPSTLKNSAFLESAAPGGAIRIVSELSELDRSAPTSDVSIRNCLIADGVSGTSVNRDFRGKLAVECTNIYGNRHGDWYRPLDQFLELALGNMAVDPKLCSGPGDALAVCADSPLLAANNSCHVPIGGINKTCEDCLDRSIQAVRLHGNHPNPFNPMTTIAFEVPMVADVFLEVLDVRGRRVRLLADRVYNPGYHEVAWEGRDDSGKQLASGVYPLRLRVDGDEQLRSMVLLK